MSTLDSIGGVGVGFPKYGNNNNFDIGSPFNQQQVGNAKSNEKESKSIDKTVPDGKPANWHAAAQNSLSDSIYGIKPQSGMSKTEDSDFSTAEEYQAFGDGSGQKTGNKKGLNKENFMAMANMELSKRLESGSPNVEVKIKDATLSSPSAGYSSDRVNALKSVGVREKPPEENNYNMNKPKEPYQDLEAQIKKAEQFASAQVRSLEQLETE